MENDGYRWYVVSTKGKVNASLFEIEACDRRAISADLVTLGLTKKKIRIHFHKKYMYFEIISGKNMNDYSYRRGNIDYKQVPKIDIE